MLLKVLSLLLVIGHSLADVPGIPIRQSLLRIGEVRDQCRDGMRMDCRDCQNLIVNLIKMPQR